MAWLDDNPPVRSQFVTPRREQWCGVVGVHTSEGVKDDVGPDTGTDVLAGFIRRRTDPGSYHLTIDSDSTLELVDVRAEAYSIAVDLWNRASWNISFVCRTVDLSPADGWTVAAIRNAGAPVVEKWTTHGFCPSCSARWLTRAEALALRSAKQWCQHDRRLGGFVCHGTLQPGDRSDAWATHPFRPELEQMLVGSVLAAAGGTPSPAPEEEAFMLVYQIAYDETTGQLWLEWGYPNQLPFDCCYLENADQVAMHIAIDGATPIAGNQGALVARTLRMSGKPRPGQGQGLTIADLATQRDQIVAGVKYILEMAGKPEGDAATFATEVVDQMAARLAA